MNNDLQFEIKETVSEHESEQRHHNVQETFVLKTVKDQSAFKTKKQDLSGINTSNNGIDLLDFRKQMNQSNIHDTPRMSNLHNFGPSSRENSEHVNLDETIVKSDLNKT